jgi:arylformamidase
MNPSATKNIFDISIPLTNKTPVWPGDPAVEITTLTSHKRGDEYHSSKISFASHNGTHIDAPFHFLADGKTLAEIPVSRFIMRTLVVEYPDAHHIGAEFMRSLHMKNCDSLLIKTTNSRWLANSDGRFHEDFIALSPGAAEEIVRMEIRLVGIDYFSIEPFHSHDHQVHHILLQNDVVILEGINLFSVRPNEYTLICLPLRVDSPDGAPVRAILVGD